MYRKEKLIITFFLVIILLQFFNIYIHLKHDCHNEENCIICLIINKMNNSLNEYGFKLYEALVIIAIIFINKEIIKVVKHDKHRKTLIGLKVELNN